MTTQDDPAPNAAPSTHRLTYRRTSADPDVVMYFASFHAAQAAALALAALSYKIEPMTEGERKRLASWGV